MSKSDEVHSPSLNSAPIGRRIFRQPVLIALAVGLFQLLPTKASADTSADLQAQNTQLAADNAKLAAEIAQLKQALQESQANSASGSGTPAPATANTAEVTSTTTSTTTVIPTDTKSAPNVVSLDAVVVGAEENVKEIPKSISVVSGTELDTFHVDNFRDILNRIGDVRTSWQNPQTTAIISRGVGWSVGTGVLDPSVGVVVDGVSYGVTGISALQNFNDIQSAEVTRGPQGIDGGKEVSVGRITITSNPASFTPEANAELILGQLGNVTTKAAIGGPIIDNKLAYRISFSRETQDGPYSNINDPENTYRNTDRTNARVQFLYTPTSDLTATWSVNVTPTGKEMCENCFNFNTKTPAYYDNIGANGQPIPFNYATDPYGKLQRRWFTQNTNFTLAQFYSTTEVDRLTDYPNTYATKGSSLNIKDKINSDLTLTSITAYQDFRYEQGRGSLTAFDWLLAPEGTETTYWQASQELKLDWQVNHSLKSETGAIYFREEFPNIGQLTHYGPDAGAWYASAAQYAILDPVNPAIPAAVSAPGWLLLKNLGDGLITHTKTQLDSRSLGVYQNFIYDLTPSLSFTAGARATKEERLATGSSVIEDEGYAPELNPVSVDNIKLNGFANDATGNLTAANSATQLALADFVAQKYFAAANYAALTAPQKLQVATAKAVRLARIGALYSQTTAQGYDKILPTFQLGSTYKLNDSESVYVSYEHGSKAGVSQIVGGTVLGGKSVPVGTENSDSYDIGFKSLFLHNTLIVDTTLYLQNIQNYIQNGVVYDPVQTALNANGTIAYLSALVNVPKVQTKGGELSVSYSGIKHTVFRFSGAFTDAVYKSFPQAADPWELSGNPAIVYTNQTGHVLAGAPKFTGNAYGDFSYPALGGIAHANINYYYLSGYYSDQSLSRYLFTKASGVTDINVGIGTKDEKYDISLLVKNAFNADDGVLLGDQTPIAYKPKVPRWAGIVIKAQY